MAKCEVADCVFPEAGNASNHRRTYHTPDDSMIMGDQARFKNSPKILVSRSSISGPLICPCGNSTHNRYNRNVMLRICKLKVHPTGALSSDFDELDEALRVEPISKKPIHPELYEKQKRKKTKKVGVTKKVPISFVSPRKPPANPTDVDMDSGIGVPQNFPSPLVFPPPTNSESSPMLHSQLHDSEMQDLSNDPEDLEHDLVNDPVPELEEIEEEEVNKADRAEESKAKETEEDMEVDMEMEMEMGEQQRGQGKGSAEGEKENEENEEYEDSENEEDEDEEDEDNEDDWLGDQQGVEISAIGQEKSYTDTPGILSILTPQTPRSSESILADFGIIVDPTWKQTICIECQMPVFWKSARKHVKKAHLSKTSAAQQISGSLRGLPDQGTFLEHLISLCADNPTPWPDHPIAPVPGLEIKEAYRCDFPGCERVRGSKRSFQSHISEARHQWEGAPSYTLIHAHPLSEFRRDRRFIQVVEAEGEDESVKDTALRAILNFGESKGLGKLPDRFHSSQELRSTEMNEIYRLFRWYEVLDDVQYSSLRQAAVAPREYSHPSEVRIRLAGRDYYSKAAANLDRLSVTTRRWIASASLNAPLKQVPFRRPQEHGTIDKDSYFLTDFLTFLIRTNHLPIENFPVIVHPITKTLLLQLEAKASSPDTPSDTLIQLIHDSVWSLLSNPTPEFKAAPNMCPLTRYMIAVALADDKGTFLPIQQIPPHYIKIQWCFRTSACWEIQLRRKDFNDSCFDTYNALIKPFLNDSEQTPFTTMRENIKHFTSVVMRQPGLPRFTWDINYGVISIDGSPLVWKDILASWQGCLSTLQVSMHKVFRGCEYDHILQFIDSKLNTDTPEEWFRDTRTKILAGYSFITDPDNGLLQYRETLLRHLANDSLLFTTVNGNLYPKVGRLWEWFAELQDVVHLLWYLTAVTCPGSARGTEWQHLYYANHPFHVKNFHCLNGLPGIEFIYGKMESQKGHTKAVLRTPAIQVSRFLILTFTTVYYAAAHIGLYIGMPKENADNYLHHMFLRFGKPMMSKDYGSYLGTITRTSLGLSMRLRDFRQLDKALLTEKCRLEFDYPEDQDQESDVLHRFHGHEKTVAQKHYALTATNATKYIPPDAVVIYQRVALAWQWYIGFIHPCHRAKVASTLTAETSASPFTPEMFKEVVGPLLQKSQASVLSAVDAGVEKILETVRSVGSSAVQHILHSLSTDSSYTRYPAPPIFVHPNLLPDVMAKLYPETRNPRWKSVAQAESVASILEQEHVFSILPTGSGKSLQFFAAPVICPTRLFVVIVPLNSIKEDMKSRLEKMPYAGFIWPSNTANPSEARLIVVPAHEAGTKRFFDFLNLPAILERLERIFIDEVHHLITDKEFRSCFSHLAYLVPLGVKFSFLTATLRPGESVEILQMLEINEPSLVREIRSYTGRLNHVYTHQQIDGDDLVQQVAAYLDSLPPLDAGERGIIYCHNIQDELIPISESLNYPTFHGKMAAEDKEQVMNDWVQGRSPWIVATTAFGEGIDQPHVRYVLTINPFGLTTKKQEDGRAGRDGKRSWCHSMWTRLPKVWKGKRDTEGTAELNAFYTTRRCLRLIEESFDGEAHSCAALSAELCQNCSSICNDHPTWYEGPAVSRIDIPLSSTHPPEFSCAHGSKNMDLDQVPLTVALAAAPIRDAFLRSKVELEFLKQILDRVQERGCVECFVKGDTHIQGHRPARDLNFNLRTFSMNMCALQMPETWSHTFCFLCWIPFGDPCMHRIPAANERLVEENCPYNETCPRILPFLISHICMDPEKVAKISAALGTAWESPHALVQWMAEPKAKVSELANPLRFVNAYHQTCIAI